jgi:hypothetical protein
VITYSPGREGMIDKSAIYMPPNKKEDPIEKPKEPEKELKLIK